MRIFVLALFCVFSIRAQTTHGDAPQAVLQVLNDQVAAWNRGDVDSFVQSYADDCKFVGKQMVRGRAQVLARYRTQYPTRAAMGKLNFTELDVKMIDKQVATVTGYFHLEREPAGGGPAQGVFSLVFVEQANGWKIMLDHTSAQ